MTIEYLWGRGGNDMTIGEAVRLRILELCREHGDSSLNKLCTISGVTQSTVNNVMSGRNNSVTVSTIKKLCDGLNITVPEFFTSALFSDLEQEIK
jgi:transcriptional regulator with XRE-family HTH domain